MGRNLKYYLLFIRENTYFIQVQGKQCYIFCSNFFENYTNFFDKHCFLLKFYFSIQYINFLLIMGTLISRNMCLVIINKNYCVKKLKVNPYFNFKNKFKMIVYNF